MYSKSKNLIKKFANVFAIFSLLVLFPFSQSLAAKLRVPDDSGVPIPHIKKSIKDFSPLSTSTSFISAQSGSWDDPTTWAIDKEIISLQGDIVNHLNRYTLGANWAQGTDPTVLTHSPGSTESVVRAFTADDPEPSIVSGFQYDIRLYETGSAGSVTLSIGGVNVFSSIPAGEDHYTNPNIITALNSNPLTITPSSDYNGDIQISVTLVGGPVPDSVDDNVTITSAKTVSTTDSSTILINNVTINSGGTLTQGSSSLLTSFVSLVNSGTINQGSSSEIIYYSKFVNDGTLNPNTEDNIKQALVPVLTSKNTNNVTTDTTPAFSIVCTTGATVELLNGDTVLATGTCANNTINLTSSTLPAGVYSLTASETDLNSTRVTYKPSTTVVDGPGTWGMGMVQGSDGFSRIAYLDYDLQNLDYVRCTNKDCSTSVQTVASSGDASQLEHPSYNQILSLDQNGFANIVFMNTDGNIEFVHCLDQDCNAKNTKLITTSNDANIGYYGQAIVTGDDHLPRIEYEDASGSPYGVHLIRCLDVDCGTFHDNQVATGGDESWDETGLVMGPDHFARILYESSDDDSLKLVRCTDDDCSTPVITEIIPDDGTVLPGYGGKVIKIGSDGFPRISEIDASTSDFPLSYIVCNDADCTDPTITQLTQTDRITEYNDFGMDLRTGDLASITYEGRDDTLPHLLNCFNVTCSSYGDIILDGTLTDGIYAGGPVAVGADNLPRVAYSDYSTGLFYYINKGTSVTIAAATHHGSSGGSSVGGNAYYSGLVSSTPPSTVTIAPITPTQPTVAPGQPVCTIVTLLKLGSKGDEVKCLQSILKITSDGIFGPQTKQAVIDFQKMHPPLTVDGIVGPKTRAVLQ